MNERNEVLDSKVESILSRLDLAQKVRLISGGDFWSTQAIPDVGLGPVVFSDGPIGVRGRLWDERDPSLCLPSSIAMAATWDEDLVFLLAQVIAAEALRKGVHVVLGPTLNLHRSPLSGRHFECFAEDALLTGRMGAAYVRGIQSLGVGACPKHYVANDSESDRYLVDVQVDERTLREIYLEPFRAAVNAEAWAVMAAYNRVNGHTMTEHPLLTDPLKDDWAFDGVVVSDWSAVRSTEESALAGIDLAMPGPSRMWGEKLEAAVNEGRVSVAAINDKAGRLVRLAARVGALGSVEDAKPNAAHIRDNSQSLLREAAAQGMVLLRNEGDLLPLDAKSLRRVALIGPNALEPQVQGGGSAMVVPERVVTPYEGIRSALSDEVEITQHVGVLSAEDPHPIPLDMLENPFTASQGFRITYFDADGTEVKSEDRFASHFVWFSDDLERVETIQMVSRLTVLDSGVHEIRIQTAGASAYKLEANGVDLISEPIVSPGDAVQVDGAPSRHAQIDLVGGQKVDIVLTFRLNRASLYHGFTSDVPYAELMLCLTEPLKAQDQIAAAAEAAAAADVSVVVVGTTWRVEREGSDRTELALPARQNDLIRAIAAANPRTIVVLNTGSPVTLPWHHEVRALLLSWFPGEQFGAALADVLLGSREPGGRLPTTWPLHHADVPVLETSSKNGQLSYAEKLNIGYRAWTRTSASPAYPFGHGLGYSTWTYRSADVSAAIGPGQDAEVRVEVFNTGARVGKEVVQIYLRRENSSIERPSIWLAGFAAVTAAPSEMVLCEIRLPARAFEHWSEKSGQWETETGVFEVLIGRSAEDIRLTAEVKVTEDQGFEQLG